MSTQSVWVSTNGIASESSGSVTQLCDRLVRDLTAAESLAEYASLVLPDVASEFGVQWVGVAERWPEWKVTAEFGRHQISELPRRFYEEALDREECGLLSLAEPPGWSVAAAPLSNQAQRQSVLALAGRRVNQADLAGMLKVAGVLSRCLEIAERLETAGRQSERLRETLRVACRLSEIFEMVPLLEALAEEATRLLDCDRASIFIWDKSASKLLACPALGVEGRTLYLPDNVGIVGSVIQSGDTIRVDDAYQDDRFNPAVDKKSGYRTRSILCVPLIDGEQNLIGAFQGINKNDGAFDSADEDILRQFGLQAAIALRNTRERERILRSHRQLTEQIASRVRIIGESAATAGLREKIERLAPTDLPVLILGESGTGKEVVSQSLHYHGPRADHPFVAVNCAALTESLLESELFGHEQGAFTDARESRKGKFELADGGTIFLDEIGDMSAGGQSKLLRVLEQKVVTRVGGSQSIPVDVRVVAATNVNLAEAVRAKKFREDLYYRLNVVTLELPPLRERPDDILPLAEHFLRQFCPQARRSVLELPPEAERRLMSHGWPGNVRELRNLMERVAFLAQGDRVETEDLAFIISPASDEETLELGVDLGLADATNRFQSQYIERAIDRSRNNMSEAARVLGLHRSNLYRKMRQLGMNVDEDPS